MSEEQRVQADFEGDSYRVTHKGEKFSLGKIEDKSDTLIKDTEEAIKASALAKEERELDEAL